MSLLRSLFEQMPNDTLWQLQRIDAFWQEYRSNQKLVATVVQQSSESLGSCDCDVVVCGGTLGIFIGCALQQKGWRVTVIEQGILRGRAQEWNISRHELDTFLTLELLSLEELEQAIATEYNPGRISFLGGQDLFVRDVLNIGVDPIFLLETLKSKFLAWGGKLLEQTGFQTATVHSDGVQIEVQSTNGDRSSITARLLLDVMGHFSPVARQARQGVKPDAVCLVVGSCAQGITPKPYGDLIVTFTPIQNQCQYFWEAFPARDGRTTYMFTYADADCDRPSFSNFFEDYLTYLPQYQDTDFSAIQFQRVLFGFFPSYRRSPLQTPWSRILQVGDSSGSQSPLSFGGFGAMVRHLQRLAIGIDDALSTNLLSRDDLRVLQPYQPNLSVTWLFQQAMSVGMHQTINQTTEGDRINRLLSVVFQVMSKLGDPVLKPFLQDVVQFSALSQTMLNMALADPKLVAQVVQQVGFISLIDWLKHYINLGIYSALYPVAKFGAGAATNLLPEQQYHWQRWLDMYQYGSGQDY